MAAGGAARGAALSVVTIERIAAGGDGVGRLPDGMVVFVPRTAPGDVVAVEGVERRRRFARGLVARLLEAGPGRVAPACRHYTQDRCGGCRLQHLDGHAQLAVKRAIAGEALRRIGGRDVTDPEIVASPAWWRYRTRIRLWAGADRLGLHPYDRPDRVFDLDDCPITTDRLMALWRMIRRHRRLLPAQLRTLTLREDRTGGLHVIVEDAGERAWEAGPLARAVGDAAVCWWWLPVAGAARVVGGPGSAFPALAFEQVNPALAVRIREAAVAALDDVAGRTVWDLYGGVGDTARLLAARGASVWSVDADRTAIEWARTSDRPGEEREQREAKGEMRYIGGRVEEVLHRLPPPDAVVVNPPRAGLAARVAEGLERWARGRPGGRLAYVSCDPATLARDLRRLPALGLVAATAYDLFPHTAHVEVLAVLEAS